MTEATTSAILKGVDFDDEGYMTDPNAWTKEIAEALAALEDVALTEAYWKVIEFCRQRATESGSAPTLRQITTGSGISTKELFALFPKGPAKKVAKISGLGKPEGCV
ncbi:MAG: TusE/DsrC/DsvC family sulfur relay protein [Anaerolineales bacterium]|nr:TusE/DsrC/DsvC family sulfur relay protein [Anaerolineales bacterium]